MIYLFQVICSPQSDQMAYLVIKQPPLLSPYNLQRFSHISVVFTKKVLSAHEYLLDILESTNNILPYNIIVAHIYLRITAVSSDSRPPNPKCLTAIIVFDIWAQSLILQQGMVSAQFWGKILHFVFIQFMWNIGVLRIRIWRILLNWRPHLNVKNNHWCQAFRI